MNVEIAALEAIAREKNLSFETVLDAMEGALANAYKRSNADAEEARVVIDRSSGEVTVFAQRLDEEGNVIDEWVDTPADAGGRMIAQTVKQVLTQRLREAERELTYGEYSGKNGDLVTGTIQIHDNRVVVLDLGNAEAVLPVAEQVPSERYEHGSRMRAIVTEVRKSMKGPQIIVSRSHPDLVASLFRLEVPEIEAGTIEIRGVAREAGYRTKIAVATNDPNVDPVGACVGPRGSRVRSIVESLNQEKIDIVTWSEEPAQLVANALSPSKVSEVYLYPEDQTALVVVPDYQLSLAIGREGQNARLAARLTRWRIDIKSETQFAEEQQAFQEALDRGEIDEFGNPIGEPDAGSDDGSAAAETAEAAPPAPE
ncbi:transcription termination factor NusA [Euzebya tangerina]|uniref:transcription termination factor NusA n=1 Tax=Euzebya tangerina TaxID=591198 RepID=UPI000E324776|nr:transcription termination factor NusA [Euzebya tangerina]